MTKSSTGRRAAAAIVATLLMAGGAACQSPGRAAPCPKRNGVREFFARRPVYGAEPRKALTIGNYAGYNYGTARRPRVDPAEPAPSPLFGN